MRVGGKEREREVKVEKETKGRLHERAEVHGDWPPWRLQLARQLRIEYRWGTIC
jgi:hypothetical protein